MKSRFLFLFLALIASRFTHAQNNADTEARKNTEALVTKYSLNADQAKQMYQIQQRKNRNMAEIAPLQITDPVAYRAKLGNVQQGTWVSIRRILNTKEQVDLYQKTQSELRGLRNAKRKEMTAQKASKEAVENAILAIYSE